MAEGGRYAGMDHPALWAGNWQQLCVSCKIIRPIRSKHCNFTDRCVEVYDHFCPWVGNAVGKNNRHVFIGFLACTAAALCIGGGLGSWRLQSVPEWDVERASVLDFGRRERVWGDFLSSSDLSFTLTTCLLTYGSLTE